MLACDSTYTVEYNFETQSPQTGQTQHNYIMVEVDQAVSQGDIIGYLYAPNNDAHLHFSLHKNWIPICPEPYFNHKDRKSMLNMLRLTYPTADMCYGGDVTPPPLITPYVNESDMMKISAGFSLDNTNAPWGFAHDGIDIYPQYPQGYQIPFRASCDGIVDKVEFRQSYPGMNYLVEVLIQCDDYIKNPGGYFIPFSVDFLIKPMSNNTADGQAQFDKSGHIGLSACCLLNGLTSLQ